MKQIIIISLLASICLLACKKDGQVPSSPACTMQTVNPAGRSYVCSQVVPADKNIRNCGLLPLSTANYWIYQDSLFTNGLFRAVKYDTLRFSQAFQTTPDGLIWWQPTCDIGLPSLFLSTDSALFQLSDRLFSSDCIKDVKKEYGLFTGDSISYLASFEDNAAMGKSKKLKERVPTPAGSFDECLLFEKNARSYRQDDVYFKPGIGVIRYTHAEAPMGSFVVSLQQVSTLVSFHFQ